MIKEYKKGTKIMLSKNFSTKEFDCHCDGLCDKTLIDIELVGALQMIRDNFGETVIINSGYRCPEHNASVGGAKRSRHMEGMAADIRVQGIEPIEVAKYAESIGIKGIGLYKWGCHIDTRSEKCFWQDSWQKPIYSFQENNIHFSVSQWQVSAISDGFKFSMYGADGKWGNECEKIAKKAICKKRSFYRYKNLTKLVQKTVGVKEDGKFGRNTRTAVIEWQNEHGLKGDGIVGLYTWKKMLGV